MAVFPKRPDFTKTQFTKDDVRELQQYLEYMTDQLEYIIGQFEKRLKALEKEQNNG